MTGMLIEWDVAIETDDGVVLRADVFRPRNEDRACPVILSYGPYAKGLAFEDGYPGQWKILTTEHPDVLTGTTGRFLNWEVVDPEKWVPDGYACVRVDSRGSGRSPGYLDPFSPREARDIYHCVEWAAARPWCDGKVGLCGISYYAMNAWHVAALNPPHLAAICVWEGAADSYRELTHHGGILSTFSSTWYPRQVITVQHGVGERGPHSRVTGEPVAGPRTLSTDELAKARTDFGADISEHAVDDWYHTERSAKWGKTNVPLLTAGNWGGQGLHSRGNFEGFRRAASASKWLEVHGLEHWTHFYTDYGIGLQKRFFARFLKGDAAAWPDEPRVRLNVRTADGGFVYREEHEWPLARTQWARLYLHGGGILAAEPAAEAAGVTYAADGDGVTFSTPPLERQTEITGPVAARLFVSSSAPDADLFAVLRVFAPDGEEVTFRGAIDPHTPVAQGWLRLSHRATDDALSEPWRPYHPHQVGEPAVPGEVYQCDVEIWPTSIVVPAGYRVALTVRGRDYVYEGSARPRRPGEFGHGMTGCGWFTHDDPADRPRWLTTSSQTLWSGGGRDAWVLLPVIPSTREDGA
jgi:predicted acyl esterase